MASVTGEFVEDRKNNGIVTPKIAIIGIGGAGNNAVNHMIDEGIECVDFIAMNTDNQDLFASKAENKLQLGSDVSAGLGAGGNPEMGKLAAEESKEDISKILDGYNMVFITAGMGGGTGTGAAPVVARIAKEMGILTVAVVTRPFSFEGTRPTLAMEGIEDLKKNIDSIIVIPNDRILDLLDDDVDDVEALKKSDETLFYGVTGITSMIFDKGTINLDFNDLRSVLKDSGIAYMGVGEATGKGASVQALNMAVNNPLVDETIAGGSCGLIVIHSAKNSMRDTNMTFQAFREYLGSEPKVFNGIYKDEQLADKVIVTVIVTGLNIEARNITKPILGNIPTVATQSPTNVTADNNQVMTDTTVNSQNVANNVEMQMGNTAEIPVIAEAKTETIKKELPPIKKGGINIPLQFGRR